MILRFLHWLPASATSSQHQESVVINTVHVFLYLFYLQIFRFYLHEISTFCCFVRVMMPNLESHLTSLSSATTNAQYSTSCIIHVKHLYIWNTYDKKYAKSLNYKCLYVQTVLLCIYTSTFTLQYWNRISGTMTIKLGWAHFWSQSYFYQRNM